MDENKHYSGISPEKPPKRLFRVIIERLKIENNLKIFKEKFGISAAALLISVILIVIALFFLNSELAESESGSLFSLLFSDTFAVLFYYKYFILSVLESIPVISVVSSLAAIVLIMISLRFVIRYYDNILMLNKSIKNK